MGALEFSLAAAAIAIGVTGTWSPCGFSMVETIGPTGHTGGLRTTLAACATFAPGALAGGALTFGLLAWLGGLVVGAGGQVAYGVAAVIALTAALAEARGAPIVPQLRRQLPEQWRRLMPMPVAAGLYGVLLGLGFTTFVLSFGVWALAGISFAVGDLDAGLMVGLGFGAGRALPIVFLAPVAGRPLGVRATELMAGRPGLYRGLRFGDAIALATVGAVLVAGPVQAESVLEPNAADPSIEGGHLAWQLEGNRAAVIARGEAETAVPGTDPAVGGPWIATVENDEIVLRRRADLAEVARVRAPGVDAVAVSEDWLAWRANGSSRDTIRTRPLSDGFVTGPVRTVHSIPEPNQLGRPALDGSSLVYAAAQRLRNRIVRVELAQGGRQVLIASRRWGLSNPDLEGGRLLYVRHGRKRDLLKLMRAGGEGSGRTLLRMGEGRLWSVALGEGRAFVTLMRGNPPSVRILKVGL
jgi:hypothetical protein